MVETAAELNISERIRWLGSSDGFVTPSPTNPTPGRGIKRHWVDILPQLADQTRVLAGDKFHQTSGFPLLSGGGLLEGGEVAPSSSWLLPPTLIVCSIGSSPGACSNHGSAVATSTTHNSMADRLI